jgi:hypothetical protein
MRRSRRPDPWRGLPAPPGLLRLLCLGLLLGGPQAATAQPLFDGSAADVWVLGADGQPVGHGTGRPSHTTAAIRPRSFSPERAATRSTKTSGAVRRSSAALLSISRVHLAHGATSNPGCKNFRNTKCFRPHPQSGHTAR